MLPTLVTYNCAASFVHHQLNAAYRTPLISNQFRSWRQYLRFAAALAEYIAAAPAFGEPHLDRRPDTDRPYPVSHHLDVEIHWLHTPTEDQARASWLRRRERIDWADVLVSFSEANFGPQTLSEADWLEFAEAWAAIPFRKLFLSTGRYGRVPGEWIMGRWGGLRHEDAGEGRQSWGGFTPEGTWIIRHLKLEDQINPAGPFAPAERRHQNGLKELG